MSQKILSISRGAQFQGGKTAYMFFVVLVAVIYCVVMLIEGEVLSATLCIAVAMVLTIYVLDIRGVEVDLGNSRFREYVIRPWGKDGKWMPLNEVKAVELFRETYIVKVKAIFSRLADPGAPKYNNERHSRYALYFTNSTTSDSVLLMESQDLSACVRFGRTAAGRLKVPFRNHTR